MRGKKSKLFLGIVLDVVGMLSFTIPLYGELSDLAWAPLAAWLMARMYKGAEGKVASTIAMIEELLPFSDFIPTFTLMWIYTYILKSEDKDKNTGKMIPVRVRS